MQVRFFLFYITFFVNICNTEFLLVLVFKKGKGALNKTEISRMMR